MGQLWSVSARASLARSFPREARSIELRHSLVAKLLLAAPHRRHPAAQAAAMAYVRGLERYTVSVDRG